MRFDIVAVDEETDEIITWGPSLEHYDEIYDDDDGSDYYDTVRRVWVEKKPLTAWW